MFDSLFKLYAWSIGYLVVVCLALAVIAALASYVLWLVVVLALLIVLRLIWYRTSL